MDAQRRHGRFGLLMTLVIGFALVAVLAPVATQRAEAGPVWTTYLRYTFDESGTNSRVEDATARAGALPKSAELSNHGDWRENNGVTRNPAAGAYEFAGWTAGALIPHLPGAFLLPPGQYEGDKGFGSIRVEGRRSQMNPYNSSFRVAVLLDPADPAEYGLLGAAALGTSANRATWNVAQKGRGNGSMWKMSLVPNAAGTHAFVRCTFQQKDEIGTVHKAQIDSEGLIDLRLEQADRAVCVWDRSVQAAAVRVVFADGSSVYTGCDRLPGDGCHNENLKKIVPGGTPTTDYAYLGAKALGGYLDGTDTFAGTIYDFRVDKFTEPPGVTFAAIGDFGADNARELAVADQVASWNEAEGPDFVVTVGDNRYGDGLDMDTAVGKYYCPYLHGAAAGANCGGSDSDINRFFPSLGNHDYNDGGGLSEYLAYFDLPGRGAATTGSSGNEQWYDFIKGPVHFFAIDSQAALNDPSSASAQQVWLENELEQSPTEWQVVFFHHSPYSSSTSHGSTPAMQWDFAAWGADLVLSGHDHIYERVERDGIVYVVTGLGGKQASPVGSPIPGSQVLLTTEGGATLNGAARIEADADSLAIEYVTSDGVVRDAHTITN